MSASTTGSDTFEIEGTTVTMPCEVRDAAVGTATFLVSARVAAGLLPAGLVPFVVVPGRTLLTLTMADYRDNDLGSYHEVAVALAVRPAGVRGLAGTVGGMLRGRVTTYTLHMPVDQEFTLAAGQQIWGFPKTLDDLVIDVDDGRASCRWEADGTDVLQFSLPTGASRPIPEQRLVTYTTKDGRLHRTSFSMGAESGRIGAGGAEIRLGDHPIAADLRRLGLPRKALFTTWMDPMRGRFGAPSEAG